MADVVHLSSPTLRRPDPHIENRGIYLTPIAIPPRTAHTPREYTMSDLLNNEGPPPLFLQPSVSPAGPGTSGSYPSASHSGGTGSSGTYSAVFRRFVDLDPQHNMLAMSIPPLSAGHNLVRIPSTSSTPEEDAAEALTSMAGPAVRNTWRTASRGSAVELVNRSVNQSREMPIMTMNSQVNRGENSQGIRRQQNLTHYSSAPLHGQNYHFGAQSGSTIQTNSEHLQSLRQSSVQTTEMETDVASHSESSTAAASAIHTNTTTPAGSRISTPEVSLTTRKHRTAARKVSPAPPASAPRAAAKREPKQSRVAATWTCWYAENCSEEPNARKVVSHFFGRNKTATSRVPEEAWCIVCRKHYQRSRYSANTRKIYWRTQATMLHTQIDRMVHVMGPIQWVIQYQVKLTEGLKKHDPKLKPKEVNAARRLFPFCGQDKSTQDVHDFVERMEIMCRRKDIDELIKVEFLPVKWGIHQKDYQR